MTYTNDPDVSDSYDLDGVHFVEIEVEVTRTETCVFAVEDHHGLGVAGQPSTGVGAFMRALNYWWHTCGPYGGKRTLVGWKFPEHDRDCEMMAANLASVGYDPDWDLVPCQCRERLFTRCEKGSLNGRRLRT